MRVAVVGGGIAGLAAAWELSADPSVQVTVFEASDRFGGKVQTSSVAGTVVDEGADAFLLRVPWALDLVGELGLEAEVVHPAVRRAYIWSRGALRPLPETHVLGVPLDRDDLASTGLLDDAELAEVDLGPTAPFTGDDTAVADLVATAVGRPVVDRLVGPLLGGINAGRVDEMSAAAVAPQLLAAARHPRGLVAGLRRQRAGADPSAPVFGGFVAGTGRLVERLVAALVDRGVTLRLRAPVRSLGDLEGDGVVVALPAFAASDLLAIEALAAIEYASVALVTLVVPRGTVALDLDASGFLVPRTEGLLLTACSWASTKWAHLDHPEHVVLRASAGAAGDERVAGLGDDALVDHLRADLGRTMALGAGPAEARVSRWPRSLPQYPVGHLDRVAEIEAALPSRVVLAGAAYRGVGLPACIGDGRAAARRLLAT